MTPLVRVTDDTTRADLEVAMTNLAQQAKRLPAHFVDRRAQIHATIDSLLYDWQAAE